MDDTIPNDESIATDKNLAALFTAAAPMFKQMKEINGGVLKITPEVGGKRYLSIILVRGEEEVAEITKAIQEVEDTW